MTSLRAPSLSRDCLSSHPGLLDALVDGRQQLQRSGSASLQQREGSSASLDGFAPATSSASAAGRRQGPIAPLPFANVPPEGWWAVRMRPADVDVLMASLGSDAEEERRLVLLNDFMDSKV